MYVIVYVKNLLDKILENTPPPWGGGNISQCHLGEKIGKGEEKKGENVKE